MTDLDNRFKHPLYLMSKALEMREIPLVMMSV